MERYGLLLLPGFDGTGSLFEPLLRILPKKFVPIVVPYPPTTPMSYAKSVDFAVPYIPDDMPCIVLGESYSGPVALRIALQYPARITAVVLCSTFTTPPVPPWLLHLGSLLPLSFVLSALPRWLLRFLLLEPTTTLALLHALQKSLHIPSSAVIRQRLCNMATVQDSKRLRRCTVPILALVGTKDKLLTPHWYTLTTSHSSLYIASIAGPHLLLQTHPQETIAAIEQFLQMYNRDCT